MAASQRGSRFGLSGSGGGGVRSGDADVEIDATAFNGATPNNVSVPGSAVAGQTIPISGVAGFDCPICTVGREVRVVANASHLTEERVQNVGILSGRGETAQFRFDIPAPQAPGQTVNVRLRAERNPPLGGWEVDNTAGPYDIPIVSSTTHTVKSLSAFAPWALGAGALGAGGAHVTDRSVVGGGVAGAGAGVGIKLALDQISGPILEFPTVPVVATAALLGSGAILISQVTDPFD